MPRSSFRSHLARSHCRFVRTGIPGGMASRHDAMQRVPVDHQLSAGLLVLFGPVHQQVEAGVIDVGEVLEVDMQLGIGRNLFQGLGEPR